MKLRKDFENSNKTIRDLEFKNIELNNENGKLQKKYLEAINTIASLENILKAEKDNNESKWQIKIN